MKNQEREFFVGIDLGGKEKKTTGICILEKSKESISPSKNWCKLCQDIFGKEILKKLNPYLKNTKVIAIDAPLTRGKGKGRMRLYEKFLSKNIFRKEKINPIPPALMSEFCDFAREIKNKLENRGFVLDINLIEVFPTMIKKILKEDLFFKRPCKNENHPFDKLRVMVSEPNHQKSASICAQIAALHSQLKTRYLGYKDGFLFLPEFSFWRNIWKEKFYQVWKGKDKLKYRRLITNVFNNK